MTGMVSHIDGVCLCDGFNRIRQIAIAPSAPICFDIAPERIKRIPIRRYNQLFIITIYPPLMLICDCLNFKV